VAQHDIIKTVPSRLPSISATATMRCNLALIEHREIFYTQGNETLSLLPGNIPDLFRVKPW
jgi:hypothetical protein